MRGSKQGLRRLLCGVAAAALTPALAAAQTDPQRPGVRVGPLQISPRLVFSNIGVDDNVFNEPENPKRDFTLTATPDVELSVKPGRLYLAYTSKVDFVYFHKYTSERSVNRTFSGRADLDLTWLRPFFTASAAHTSARLNSEIDSRARHHPRAYAAGASLKLASRTSVTFTARSDSESYDPGLKFRGVELSRSLDNETKGYEASFNVNLTPFTTVSLVAAKDRQRFDHASIKDADSLRIAPTVTFSPLGQITGTASVGFRRFNGLDPSLPDYSGFVSTGTIGLLLGGQYKLDTIFSRDVRFSYEEGLPYYILTGGRATLAIRTVGALDVRVTGGRESMNYRALGGLGTPGLDRLVIYGTGFGYRFAERIRMAVEAEFSHRTSERDTSREYSNRRIMATLNWGATNQ
jgi:hypothetical protein